MLLIGAPGIGKTTRIRELAQMEAIALGREFIDLREASIDLKLEILKNPQNYYVFYRIPAPYLFPEDVNFPVKEKIDGKTFVMFVPPIELKILSTPGIQGVLFIDELTNVQRLDQRAMFMSLIEERELGWGIRIADGIKIICAANPPEWSRLATDEIDLPRRSRLTIIQIDPATVKEWVRWMDATYGSDNWDKRIFAYLMAFPDDWMLPKEKIAKLKPLENFPCPRNWTELALITHRLQGQEKTSFFAEIVTGRIGDDVARRLLVFLRTKIPDIESILRQPGFFRDLELNEKLLVIWKLAKDWKRLIKKDKRTGELKGERFVRYLDKNERELLMVFLLMLNDEARTKILEHFDFSEFIDNVVSFFGIA